MSNEDAIQLETAIPLDELTVAELADLSDDARVVCPVEGEHCVYKHQGEDNQRWENYATGQVAKHPKCEADDCYLAVIPE